MKKPEIKLGRLSLSLAMPVLGVALLLAAAWMGWQGMQVQSATRLGEETSRARENLAQELRPGLKAALSRLDAARERAALATALQRGDEAGARELIGSGWKDAE